MRPDTQQASRPTASATSGGLPTLTGALFLRFALILALGIAMPFVIRAAAPQTSATSAALYANAWVIIVDLVTIAVVASLLRREGQRLGSLLAFRPADLGWGLVLFGILFVAFFACTFVANLIVYQGPPPSGEMPSVPLWVGLLSIVAAITIGVAEEVMYRGYLQPRFADRIGRWPGLLLVAAVFGLQHLGFALTSPEYAISRVLATFGTGVVFGLLYLWRGRLMPLIIAHVVLDLIGLSIPTLMAAL